MSKVVRPIKNDLWNYYVDIDLNNAVKRGEVKYIQKALEKYDPLVKDGSERDINRRPNMNNALINWMFQYCSVRDWIKIMECFLDAGMNTETLMGCFDETILVKVVQYSLYYSCWDNEDILLDLVIMMEILQQHLVGGKNTKHIL